MVPRLGQCVLAYVSSFLNDSTKFSPLDRSVIAALLPHSIAFGDIISSAFGLCELFFEGEDYPKIECHNTRFSSPPRSRPPPACPLPCVSSLATSSRENAGIPELRAAIAACNDRLEIAIAETDPIGGAWNLIQGSVADRFPGLAQLVQRNG